MQEPRDRVSKLNPRVPVVGPSGQFKEPRCGPHPDTVGGMRIAVFNRETMEYGVFKSAKIEGWVLYKDMCEGRYKPCKGGKPIVAPEYFAKWQKLVEARGESEDGLPLRRITNLPDDFYHPEIYDRKNSHTNGREDVDATSMFDEPKGSKEPVAKATRSRGQSGK